MLFSNYFPSYENMLHCEVWVLQIVAYSFLGFDAMWSGVDLTVFWRNLPPSSSTLMIEVIGSYKT